MDNNISKLNIVLAVADTVVASLAIAAFGAAAYVFCKWWILLFALLPITLFYSHSIIIDADIQEAEIDQLSPPKAKTLNERDDQSREK